MLSYKLSLHYYCSVHVTEECVELAKNYFCLLLDIKRSNSLAICTFTGLLKVHHDLSSIIWIYFLFFSFGDILQYRVCSPGTLIIKATKSSTWTVGFFFAPNYIKSRHLNLQMFCFLLFRPESNILKTPLDFISFAINPPQSWSITLSFAFLHFNIVICFINFFKLRTFTWGPSLSA